ncbi:MAG: phosphotransferase family protein, partial [Pseudomonadota bacterium]
RLYAENAGLSEIPDLSFPLAFSFFRMGAILQGVKKRALDGNASNPEKAMKLAAYVPLFAQTALARLTAEA